MSKTKYYVVSLSGGKDSTAMLLRLLEEHRPVDRILFCDTGLEFPQMYEHLTKLERYIGRPIMKILSCYIKSLLNMSSLIYQKGKQTILSEQYWICIRLI